MSTETLKTECVDSFQTVNNYKTNRLNGILAINKNAETTAKQMILIRSLMGDKCEDVDYTDNLPYPHIEKAKQSKIKLEKWEAEVILCHYDSLELDMQTSVKADLYYILTTAEIF